MKILLIHLSDLHCQKAFHLPDNYFSSFFEPISNYNPDIIYILFTGDLTQGGYKNQAEFGRTILSSCKHEVEKILAKPTKLLFVPGNHDITLTNLSRTQDQILASSDSEKKSLLKTDLLKMQDVMCPVKEFHTFSKEDLAYSVANDDCVFFLLNSAPFSSLSYDDKEHHFFPKEAMPSAIHTQTGSYSFLLMHHRPDWFDAESMKTINNFIDHNVSLAFFGHEHEAGSASFQNETGKTIVSFGGTMSLGEKELSGSYNCIVFDTNDGTFEQNTYSRSPSNGHYIGLEHPVRGKLVKKMALFSPTSSFCEKTLSVRVQSTLIKLADIFVMPFATKGILSSNDAITYNDLLHYIDDNPSLTIIGSPEVGKTTLLLQLFQTYSLKYATIFLNAEDITANPETTIKNCFQTIYGNSDEDYRYFLSLPKEQKMLFIDGENKEISKSAYLKFSQYVADHFGKIIKTKTYLENDTAVNEAKKELGEQTVIRLYGMSLAQRNEYIKKISVACGISDDQEIHQITDCVSSAIVSCSVLDVFTPYSILILTATTIDKRLFEERNVADAFSILFENRITNKLQGLVGSQKLEDYYNILSRLSLQVYIHRKQTSFTISDIEAAINETDSMFAATDLDTETVAKALVESEIISKRCANEYQFTRNSFLSFFIAKAIITDSNNGNGEYIKDVLSNLWYGLNSDILLFIAYETKDVHPIFDLEKQLAASLEKIEPLDFDHCSNPILLKTSSFPDVSMIESESEEQLTKRLDQGEKKQRTKAAKEEETIFEDPEKNPETKRIITIIKSIEILAKVSSGFKTQITGENRKKIINTTLSSLYKYFNLLFGISQREYDELSLEFVKAKNDMRAKEPNGKLPTRIEKMDLSEFLYDFMTSYILNVSTMVASILTSDTSLPFIKAMDCTCFSQKLFHIICFERRGQFNQFKDAYSKILNETEEEGQIFLLARVANLFKTTAHLTKPQGESLDSVLQTRIHQLNDKKGDPLKKIAKSIDVKPGQPK